MTAVSRSGNMPFIPFLIAQYNPEPGTSETRAVTRKLPPPSTTEHRENNPILVPTVAAVYQTGKNPLTVVTPVIFQNVHSVQEPEASAKPSTFSSSPPSLEEQTQNNVIDLSVKREPSELNKDVKQELRSVIQMRRRAEGLGELTVDFRDRVPEQTDEEMMTAEERTRRNTRKLRNRLAARKCREKKKYSMQTLEQIVSQLQKRQKELLTELRRLEKQRQNFGSNLKARSKIDRSRQSKSLASSSAPTASTASDSCTLSPCACVKIKEEPVD